MLRLLSLILFFTTMPAVAAEITSTIDVAYGNHALQKLDIYAPKNCVRGGCPVVMWVHGGGWRNGDKNSGGPRRLAGAWCQAGAVLVAVNYRLTPEVMHPAHVQDVAAAINWVNKNIHSYGGNPNKVSLLGHSAGAHLVALVATDIQYLQPYDLHPATALHAVFPIDSASYDLNRNSKEPLVGRMIKDAFGTNAAALAAASPITVVQHNRNGKYPRFVVAAVAPRNNAILQMNMLVAELQRAGGSATSIVVETSSSRQMRAHGEIAKDLADSSKPMTRQLMAEAGLQP